MTDEQFIAKGKYAGEKNASMKRRDIHHDYTARRMYMITLEVEGRRPVFGHLVGNPFAQRGSSDESRIELSALGKAVQTEWLNIHLHYPQIEVMAIQMMPDHLHGILYVREPLPVHLGKVISGFKTGCRKAQRALEAAAKPQHTEKQMANGSAEQRMANGSAEQRMANGSAEQQMANGLAEQQMANGSAEQRMVNGMAATAREAAAGASVGAANGVVEHGSLVFPYVTASPSLKVISPYQPLFAKGYNDLILRSFEELQRWKNYLSENPRRLMMKRARPEWLRPFFGLHIGSHVYSGIGNRSLLTSPSRIVVRVSRRRSDSEIAVETTRYLSAARQGAILVSPAISPGEKRVMRAAFDAGLPIIVIMENGFTPLSKPHGEQFDACARGLLLMLAPWEHHNEKKKITAEQCQQMNLMALEICGQQ